jgi:hypothetical protein
VLRTAYYLARATYGNAPAGWAGAATYPEGFRRAVREHRYSHPRERHQCLEAPYPGPFPVGEGASATPTASCTDALAQDGTIISYANLGEQYLPLLRTERHVWGQEPIPDGTFMELAQYKLHGRD